MLHEQDFLILDAIDRHKPASQRALARFSGMSLGKTNSTLKELVTRGLVKVSIPEKSDGKNRYTYYLTPQGLKVKAQLTTPFIKARLKEFEEFRSRLLENLFRLQDQGVRRLVVLGSDSLGNLLAHIARRENLELRIIGTARSPNDLDAFASQGYDSVLLADEPKHVNPLLESRQIPPKKIARLR